ncbi:MAG: 2-phospho-L-lactate transferase CofD family protein [Candidatus Omnitrophica bacterium]|nr:2-phospho-L-lactate transferase CofD family protein [Candidatus Omnitrophota bacterium]
MIKDIREAIIKSRAKKIYICNLMTKPGETADYDTFDHIAEILRYLRKIALIILFLPITGSCVKTPLIGTPKRGSSRFRYGIWVR